MKIEIIKFGKPAFAECRSMTDQYEKRLRKLAPTDNVLLKASEDDRVNAKLLAKVIAPLEKRHRQQLICLDEHGKPFPTMKLADNLRTWRDSPEVDRVTFVVGGPYGLPQQLLEEANSLLSFGPGTFPSDIAWLLTWEQVYRAQTIIHRLPYHHE